MHNAAARIDEATLPFATIAELSAALRTRQISCVELIKFFGQRLDTLAPLYNALALSLTKQAHAAAKDVDGDIKRERFRGPLQGIPYGVKDLISVAKYPTTWGAKPFADQVFDCNATVINRLEKAKAILIGKLSMVELAGGVNLFGVAGRKLLADPDFPEPWRGHVQASLELIDDLERRIAEIERWLRRSGADHRYIPLLMTAPGIGWVTGFTIASEIGEINRFSSPTKLTGYTGLCPRVRQSGEMDRRGPLSKHGPRYLRWGLMEAAIAASSHPLYKERYQRTKRRLGRQRGAKGAQLAHARKLTEAIWYMLTRNQPFKPFAPAGAIFALTA